METNTLIETNNTVIDEKPKRTQEDYDALFEVYATWKALPVTMLRTFSRDQIRNNMNVEDEDMLDLMEIPTQKAFAEKFDVEESTLSGWNKKVKDRDPLAEVKKWSQGLVKNMMLSLYTNAMKKGDAFLYKLFFQVANEWSEKSVVEHDIAMITEFNVSLADPIEKKVEIPNVETTNNIEEQKTTTNKNKLETDRKTIISVPILTGQRN